MVLHSSSGINHTEERRKIAARLTAYVILFAVIVTVALTAWELYSDYNFEIDQIDRQIQEAYDLYHQSIAKASWDLDKVSANLLINGLLKLKYIEYLSVKTELGHTLAQAGVRPEAGAIFKSFNLVHTAHGRAESVGTMVIVAGLKEAHQSIKKKTLAFLAAETVRIIIIVTFILFFFHRLVARHLRTMADYTQQLDVNHLHKPLILDRTTAKEGSGDELDRIASAINEMRVDLLRDITKLKKTEKELREVNERYFAVQQANPDPTVVYDYHGRTEYLNPAFTKVFGWALEDVKGKPIDFVPESERELTADAIKELKGTGLPISLESKRLTKDGKCLDVAISAAPVLDAAGNTTGTVVDLKDITDQKKMEGQLRQSQKMEAVGTLAGGIAHDFNNILAAIMGYSELGLHAAKRGRPTENEHWQVLKAAERAKQLVQQILTFSRRAEFRLKPLKLNREIGHVIPILERTLPRMVKVKTDLMPDLNMINADSNQIEQVMLNLAINASDAMPEGGTLLIGTENIFLDEDFNRDHLEIPTGNYVVLRLTDTGHGMDQETMNQIFDPFFTTKEVGKGTGLGMSSVFGIVKGHKGHITCDSRVGQGTTFSLYFPTLVSEKQDKAPEARTVLDSPGGNETILVVDDEKAIRDICRKVLSVKGYKVITAENGERALELYSGNSSGIDMVILDVSMPGMGGFRCLQEILKIDPKAKVLIASGYSPDVQLEESMASGAVGYIVKPFRMSEVLDIVRRELDN